jgi:hypothetical protein
MNILLTSTNNNNEITLLQKVAAIVLRGWGLLR